MKEKHERVNKDKKRNAKDTNTNTNTNTNTVAPQVREKQRYKRMRPIKKCLKDTTNLIPKFMSLKENFKFVSKYILLIFYLFKLSLFKKFNL